MLRNKYGKPDAFGHCPCTADWKSIEIYFAWVRKNEPFVSNHYLAYHLKKMKQHEPGLKKATGEEYEFEAAFTDEIFHFVPGQDYPDYCKSGIFGNSTVWDIQIGSDTAATVNVTFKLPQTWGNELAAYKMSMIKEGGNWKLAANLEEGAISPAYK